MEGTSLMKVAVIGTGYVAQAYLRVIHYLGYHPLVLSRSWLDYTDYGKLKFCLKVYQPYLVINCAGYTGKTVDDCEVNRDACYKANAFIPYVVSAVCSDLELPLIHISTGCMYQSTVEFGEAKRELDAPDIGAWNVNGVFPLMDAPFYTNCKLLGEKAVETSNARHWIFRIRMPFNHVNSHRNWLIKLCNHERILDGWNSITFLDEFCMRSFHLVTDKKAPCGVYHAAYSKPVRTIEVAKMLFDAGLRKLPVVEYNSEEFRKTHVKRSNAILDCSKFENAYGTPFGDPISAINWSIKELKLAIDCGKTPGHFTP